MAQISSEILTFTSEAAVLSKHGKISFANNSALDILGYNCVGKSVKTVFGPEIAGAQASSFAADVCLMEKHYLLRVTRIEGGLAIFFSLPANAPALLNDAFLFSLRSALMNISMALDMGRSRAENLNDRALSSCFSAITGEYYRISRSINNASTAHSIFNGQLAFTPAMVNITELYSEIIRTMSLLKKDVEFGFTSSAELKLCADPMLLEQLLTNLISNSLVHGAGLSRINVNLMESGDHIILSVSDDGCGIEPENLHAVFSRYMHGFDISGLGRGAGLGLTVVRGIAERHGGTLLLESRPGMGTTVRVSLSKKLGSSQTMHSPQEPYRSGMSSILIGLADCLDEDCFSEKYMD